MSEEIQLDLERQEKAKEYERIQRRLMLVGLVFGTAYSLAWLVFGWSGTMKTTLLGYTTNPWILVAAFAAGFGGIYFLIDLPMSFYSDFILPHRYNLSNQDLKGWVMDQIKALLVGVVLGFLMLELIYAVLRAFPDQWWLIAAGVMLIFNVLLANLAPLILFPIFFKFTPLGQEHDSLVARLLSLSERAHTQVRGVYQFDMSRRTTTANAALTGLGNTRRIILGDTLLDHFSEEEIETILAHELGHHVHKDIPIAIVVDSLLTLVGFYLASLGLNWGVSTFGFEGPADIAAMPFFMLVLGAFGLIFMPINNAYSRWRERRADQFALEITDNAQAYASALTRLANQNLADIDPEPWVEWLLLSHPALTKRIAMAHAYESQMNKP